ncbi:TcaA 3rd/4th domain-containing protein [Oceanobacillus damuensis]|uniref:TcaA 3rd/4th domain-containing protein n=1 Tax=Oceanobacillus damuensis TaxID=937928 RepID=UPI000AE7A1AA
MVNASADDFTLYVNGEKTDIVLNEGEQSIGEFPNDGSVKLEIRKECPWGVVKSDEYN